MISSKVTSKGQITIPAEVRKKLGLKPGMRVVIRRQGKGLLIEPNAYEAVKALRGKYAGTGLEEQFQKDRREDEEKAEKKLRALYEDLRS